MSEHPPQAPGMPPSSDPIEKLLADVLRELGGLQHKAKGIEDLKTDIKDLKKEVEEWSAKMDRGPDSMDRRLERLEISQTTLTERVGKIEAKREAETEAATVDKRLVPYDVIKWLLVATAGVLVGIAIKSLLALATPAPKAPATYQVTPPTLTRPHDAGQ